MGMSAIKGRILNEGALKVIHSNQKAKMMTTVSEQNNLKKTFLNKVRLNYPANAPEIALDINNPDKQLIFLDSQVLNSYNISKYLSSFEKLAPKATAGLRENYDVLNFNNPNYMYNKVFLSILIEAEAKFLKDLHVTKREKLSKMDLSEKAEEIEKNMSKKTIKEIKKIFGDRNLVEILELLRDRPLKIIGKEVRPQTDQMLELEARISAANGITVITTKNYTDTTNIYLNSFLCYLLGSDGGTFYTPSHSSVYVLGRKALAGDGAQLLPEVYENFIKHLNNIFNEANSKGYQIKVSRRDDNNILQTLTYKGIATLFKNEALNPLKSQIDEINKAADNGLKIVLNTLSGSAAKSLAAQFKAFGINSKIFDPLWAKEDSFFNAGYAVVEKDGKYFVDHLGEDTTAPGVVRQIPYAEVLKDAEIGKLIYECDPDNDRFVVKQVLDEKYRPLCEEFGIDVYELGNGKILAAPSPNKTFLLLDIADYERMKASGEWNTYHYLYFPTYVSSAAWVEFGKHLEKCEGNISTFLSRVGFKNFNGILAGIQDWWFNQPEVAEYTVEPQIGERIVLNRNRALRVLSKEEESGGRTGGFSKPLVNILGEKSFSLPEKAVGDALFAHLYFIAKKFNNNETTVIPEIISSAYEKYGLVSKIDYRFDILHGDQGIIAQVPVDEANKLKANASAQKDNFNNLFFSMANAIRDKKIDLEKAKEILTFVIPTWKDTWDCLSSIRYVTETVLGVEGPEGVQMIFEKKDGKIPMVTQFKFRPSGTDPLKSKVYLDAEKLSTESIAEIKSVFDGIKEFDLYRVVEKFGITSVKDKPALLDNLNLRQI